MRILRRLLSAAVVGAIACGAAACASGRCDRPILPADLPENPEPCTQYCRVWVPPVYRKVPHLVEECAPCVAVPETIERTRYAEVCVKPSQVKACKTPDSRCEVAAVQTTPGGWQWKRDGCDCWKYVYVPPCYAWCTKTVGEEGIAYCAETPAEWKTVAWTERQTCIRKEAAPPRYRVEWCDECYQPGHYEWQSKSICGDCIECNRCPCPPLPRGEPCPPGPVRGALTDGCDRCN